MFSEVIKLLFVPFKSHFYFGSSRLISEVGVLISRTFSVGCLTDDERKSPTRTGYVLSTSSCEILKNLRIIDPLEFSKDWPMRCM